MQKESNVNAPKVCPNCSGYGLLFKTMHYPADTEPEKLPAYYPERQISTVSADTLLLWRENCKKEIVSYEAKIRELQGGIRQTTQELARREDLRKVAN